MENTLFTDKIFYHIYPLGLFNCPKNNDFSCPAGDGFEKLSNELPSIRELGFNALYIGPVFESSCHGYDTLTYNFIDRRLGNNEKFANFCKKAKALGFSLVLDAVFNHTGRDFFAFKDIKEKGQNSIYKDWYLNLNFNRNNEYNDGFDYDGWAGCKDLVKLNVDNPEVKNHIFEAIKQWIKDYEIDGLRLDAADVLSKNFLSDLGNFCRSIKNDFWLMGEVVHGDYNEWVQKGRIDSVTNYQIYKSLWSSFNENNLYEAAYNLNREFGQDGMYNYSALYNFLDNHDVNRIASTVKRSEYLYPLYGMLYTIPGIPSIYYGSENGIKGKRDDWSDYQLRPSLPPFTALPDFAKPDTNPEALRNMIKTLARIRSENIALQKGSYNQLFIDNQQFIYERCFDNNRIVVCVNQSEKSVCLRNKLSGTYYDLLGNKQVQGENLDIPPTYLLILKQI